MGPSDFYFPLRGYRCGRAHHNHRANYPNLYTRSATETTKLPQSIQLTRHRWISPGIIAQYEERRSRDDRLFTPELTIGGKLESFFSSSSQIRCKELVRSSDLSSPGIRKLALNVVQALLEQSRYSLVYLLRKHMFSAMLPDFFFAS